MSRDGGREDLFEVHLFIDGQDCGVWDRLSGGDLDSDDTKYRPGGGMGDQESLGGPRQVSNITLTRRWKLGRDTSLLPLLQQKVGTGDCVASKMSLDASYNAFGDSLVYNGTLKSVSPPDYNSSSNDAALIALEISSARAVATAQ
jgi:hypothetical protein